MDHTYWYLTRASGLVAVPKEDLPRLMIDSETDHGWLAMPLGNQASMGDWAKDVKVDTFFVSVPGLISAECKLGEKNGYYLSIKVKGNPDDPRTDDIVGDVVSNGTVSKEWGLHLIDIPLVMGNLLDLTKVKAEAHAKK